MRPVVFPEANLTLTKPTGMTDEECSSLQVHDNRAGQIISCWELDHQELEIVKRTKRVWLYVYGQQHPPVLLSGNSPFGVVADAVASGPIVRSREDVAGGQDRGHRWAGRSCRGDCRGAGTVGNWNGR